MLRSFLRVIVRHKGKLIVLALLTGAVAAVQLDPRLKTRAISYGHSAMHWAGLAHDEVRSDLVFWCPMHPQIKRNRPNDVCPICNMALVPLEGGSTEPPEHLTLTARQVQQAGVSYEPVIRRMLYREIDTTGRIEHDERHYVGISSWIRGRSRIEELHVNFTGQHVEKGELMAEMYSPELITAQEEYLLALKMADRQQPETRPRDLNFGLDPDSMISSSRDKLLYQGMTPQQIEELSQTRRVKDRIPVYAPASGTVIQRHVQEGQYVNEGDWLFHLADLSQLWILADIYEEELPLIEVGQPVTISVRSFPNEEFSGTVAFIDPLLNKQTRTVSVRIDVPNPQRRLKPGMFARVQLRKGLGETLAVPANAVLWSGERQVAIVRQGEGTFQPRAVRTDPMWAYAAEPDYVPGGRVLEFGSGRVRYHQVFSGLAPGEQVVTAGAFLLAAESQFQSVLTKMLPPTRQSATLAEAVGSDVADRIRKVLNAYYGLSQALAEDKLEIVSLRASELRQAASSLQDQATSEKRPDLSQQARQLADLAESLAAAQPEDLHEARIGFGRISRTLVTLLSDHGGQTLFGSELFLFRCGMAKVGYENWVWWSPEIHNPYMGQKMLSCGTRLDVLDP